MQKNFRVTNQLRLVLVLGAVQPMFNIVSFFSHCLLESKLEKNVFIARIFAIFRIRYPDASEHFSDDGSLRRLMDVHVPAQDQNDGGNEHEQSRHSKSQ